MSDNTLVEGVVVTEIEGGGVVVAVAEAIGVAEAVGVAETDSVAITFVGADGVISGG